MQQPSKAARGSTLEGGHGGMGGGYDWKLQRRPYPPTLLPSPRPPEYNLPSPSLPLPLFSNDSQAALWEKKGAFSH